MTTAYLRNLATKALVLRELQNLGTPTGEGLLARIAELSQIAGTRDSTYDFVYWTGATFWDLLDAFVEWGFVDRFSVDDHCSKTKFTITEQGEKFLQSIKKDIEPLMSLFAPTIET